MSKNLSAKYYQENKVAKKSIAYKNYKKKFVKYIRIFLMKKKKKKQQYGRELYKNLLEDVKQKFVENRKQFYKIRKKFFLTFIF